MHETVGFGIYRSIRKMKGIQSQGFPSRRFMELESGARRVARLGDLKKGFVLSPPITISELPSIKSVDISR